MLKTIIAAALAVYGVSWLAPDTIQEEPPQGLEDDEGQHFCCGEVSEDGKNGKNCSAIGKESINSCNDVLYCKGHWHKSDGKVFCDEED